MCVGCNIPEKEKQQLLDAVETKALSYAKEINKLVVMYDADGVPNYMEAEAAKLAGVRVIKYIPHL